MDIDDFLALCGNFDNDSIGRISPLEAMYCSTCQTRNCWCCNVVIDNMPPDSDIIDYSGNGGRYL